MPSLAAAEDAETGLTFERDIRPIFRAHCYDCHGATDELAGELDLRLVHQATLLHLFGLDWRKLTYHYNAREEIITNQRPARVVSEILTHAAADTESPTAAAS